MAIADLKLAQTVKGPTCDVCTLLNNLAADEADALRQLLRDSTVRYIALADALREDPDTNIDIAPNTLSRHARGRCSAREKLR